MFLLCSVVTNPTLCAEGPRPRACDGHYNVHETAKEKKTEAKVGGTSFGQAYAWTGKIK